MIDPRALIGKQLKDDIILEIIEDNELKVWYDIDTTHENIPDAYWVQDFEHGFALKCDETQRVVCCFIYLREDEGYSVFEWAIPDLVIKKNRIPALGEPTKSGAYEGNSWVRYDGSQISVHLSYDKVGVRMVTFMDVTQVE